MLSVADILRQPDDLAGETVEVAGTLVAVPDGVYLADRSTPLERWQEMTLQLVCEGLQDRLFAAVPVRVGGPFYYYDAAVVRGELATPEAGAALVRLRALRVERGDACYDVSLD